MYIANLRAITKSVKSIIDMLREEWKRQKMWKIKIGTKKQRQQIENRNKYDRYNHFKCQLFIYALKYRLSQLIKKQYSAMCCLQETHFKCKDTG